MTELITFILTALLMLILLTITHDRMLINDCDKVGYFRIGESVFECRRVTDES